MNRYDVEGLTRDVLRGRRVIAVYGTNRDAREALESVTRRMSNNRGIRVRRSNGAEAVENLYSGGFIRFTSFRSQLHRGMVADILYLDVEVPDEAMHSLIPCVQASPRAEVLRR